MTALSVLPKLTAGKVISCFDLPGFKTSCGCTFQEKFRACQTVGQNGQSSHIIPKEETGAIGKALNVNAGKPVRIVRFTRKASCDRIGTGTTGKVREGYFAGWKLIEAMLEDGMTFADIARIKETDMASVLEKYI